MTPYYADDWLTVYLGDCREVMAQMAPESVHCVVTSPPFWGLRDYGVAGQLGLEPTPEAYVESLVAVFREVRRVLRSDGTVWLNLGDSYAASGGDDRNGSSDGATGRGDRPDQRRRAGLKPKDLVGIPWRVAFALQADGWYLRSDIIWNKANPMPESVTDRPTKSHEYLFLLSKSARYYYDADAVREGATTAGEVRGGGHKASTAGIHGNRMDGQRLAQLGALPTPSARNLRSVWTIATQPYPGAHFATFPAKLVEPCIKAGTSERGVCPECGAPWVRETERTPIDHGMGYADTSPHKAVAVNGNAKRRARTPTGHSLSKVVPNTTGWRPSCAHDATCEWCGCPIVLDDGIWTDRVYMSGELCPEGLDVSSTTGASPHRPVMKPPIPATVLDCFAGSGTTGMVAQSLSRKAVLIDLSADYLRQLMGRNRDIPLGLESA